jgi:nicotinamide-nucleotide amidase
MEKFTQELINKTERLIKSCKENNIKVVSAESCTGGLFGALMTEIPGCSACYDHGFITYSNQAKNKLISVPDQIIEKFGAVSEQVAIAMAEGVLKNSDADLSIAITGVAGPGGTEFKPVGLVYIASSYKSINKSKVIRNNFTGDRAQIRMASIDTAVDLLFEMVTNNEPVLV